MLLDGHFLGPLLALSPHRQVSDSLVILPNRQLFFQITLRTVDYTLIWKHLLHSKVTHYCGAPTVQVCALFSCSIKLLPILIHYYVDWYREPS